MAKLRAQPEPFNGGLVTNRHPSLLEPGELSACINAVLRPYSQSLHAAPGRTKTATDVFSAPVTGLWLTEFNNGNQFVIGQGNSFYFRSASDLGPPWNTFQAVTGDTSLRLVAFNGRYVMLNGVDRNYVLRDDGTIRGHGMLPVTVALKATPVSGTFSDEVDTFYEYWATEVARFEENGEEVELESTATITAVDTVFIATGQTAQITLPPPTNTNPLTTHWRIYRSIGKEIATDTLFPVGSLVAEVPVDITQFTDGTASASTLRSPTTAIEWADSDPDGTVADPTNIFSSNNARCVLTAPAAPVGEYTVVGVDAGSFGFVDTEAISEPIAGIEVTVEGLRDGAAVLPLGTCTVELVIDGGVLASKTVALTTSETTITLGSSSDLWGRSAWAADEFSNANFVVRLKWTAQTFPTVASIDHIQVRIHHSGTNAADTTQPFPALQLTINGVEDAIGENGQPPIGSTGAIFEGSLVTNDVANPRRLRYSVAESYEAFPELYFIDFEDNINFVEVVRDKLVVGLDDGIWAVNYLPNEADAIISRGEARELLDAGLGITNPNAACLFRGPTGKPLLAFVNLRGLFYTDGFEVRPLNNTLDWDTLFDQTLAPSQLKLYNNHSKWELVLAYPSAASGTDVTLRFPYHPAHVKPDGTLKACGPCTATNFIGGSTRYVTAMASSLLEGQAATIWYGYSNGEIYYEEDTALIPHSGADDAVIATRQMFLSGFGQEAKIDDVLLNQAAPNADAPLTIALSAQKTGAAETTIASKSLPSAIASGEISKIVFGNSVEGARLVFTIPDGKKFALNYFTLKGVAQGDENSLNN